MKYICGISIAAGIAEWLKAYIRQGLPCLFRLMTGMYCPGCGGTRAVRFLLRGRLAESFFYHPLVPYMALVAVMEGASWLAARRRGEKNWQPPYWKTVIFAGVAIILVNWAVKNYWLLVLGVRLIP